MVGYDTLIMSPERNETILDLRRPKRESGTLNLTQRNSSSSRLIAIFPEVFSFEMAIAKAILLTTQRICILKTHEEGLD